MFTKTISSASDSNSESDSDEERIVLHVYDDESKEFTSLTTYHGMIRIYTSQTWPSRIFWGVVVITCVTLFMAQGGVLLKFYSSHPTATKTYEIGLPASLLPSLSICPHGFRENDNLFKLIIEGDKSVFVSQKYLNDSTKFITDSLSYACEMVVEQISTHYNRNIGFCQNSRKQISNIGVCYTFDGWNNNNADFLRITLKKNYTKALTFHIHDQTVPVSRTTTSFWIKHGTNAKFSFRVEEKNFLSENEWGTCKVLDAGKPYNYSKCTNECLIAAYYESCGCHPFFDESTNNHCQLSQLRNCSKLLKTTCHCPIECNIRNFVLQPLSMINNNHNTTTVTVILNSKLLRVYNQYKRFKQIDLMSYVGGVMGLFLGMSCITLLEVLVYLVKTVFGTLNDTRHKEFFNRLESCDDDNTSHEEIIITKKNEKRRSSKNDDFVDENKDNGKIEYNDKKSMTQNASSHPMNLKLQLYRTTHALKRGSVYQGTCDF